MSDYAETASKHGIYVYGRQTSVVNTGFLLTLSSRISEDAQGFLVISAEMQTVLSQLHLANQQASQQSLQIQTAAQMVANANSQTLSTVKELESLSSTLNRSAKAYAQADAKAAAAFESPRMFSPIWWINLQRDTASLQGFWKLPYYLSQPYVDLTTAGLDMAALPLKYGASQLDRLQKLNRMGRDPLSSFWFFSRNIDRLFRAMFLPAPPPYYSAKQRRQDRAKQGAFYAGLAFLFRLADREIEQKKYYLYQAHKQIGSQNPLRFLSQTIGLSLAREQGPLLVSPSCKDLSKPAAVPKSVNAMLKTLSQVPVSKETGTIRVIKLETGDHTAWSVYIPGTQTFTLDGNNPQDLSSDFYTNSGQLSDLARGVQLSLDQAGYQPGQPVELIGHSLGAATAAQFGAVPSLAKRYNVQSVLTIGGNLGNYTPVEGVRMVAIENSLDIVPALDGMANHSGKDFTTIIGADPGLHSQKAYQRIASRWANSDSPDYRRFMKARELNLHINQHTVATSTDYLIERPVLLNQHSTQQDHPDYQDLQALRQKKRFQGECVASPDS